MWHPWIIQVIKTMSVVKTDPRKWAACSEKGNEMRPSFEALQDYGSGLWRRVKLPRIVRAGESSEEKKTASRSGWVPRRKTLWKNSRCLVNR